MLLKSNVDKKTDVDNLSISSIIAFEAVDFNEDSAKYIGRCQLFPSEYDYFSIGYFEIYEIDNALYFKIAQSYQEAKYYKISDKYVNLFS
jgi:hypothetical protein